MAATTQHGFFHSIKEKLFHGEKHADSDYEAAFAKFSSVSDAMHKLRANTSNFASSVYSVFQNSNGAAGDFALMLGEASNANPYQELSTTNKLVHAKLNNEKQQLIAGELTEKVLKPIDEALKTFVDLQHRITKRNELHGELEYYLNKVHELNKERDERTSKGKSETAKNVEKFERNQQKLNTSRNEYTAFTSSLMADLSNSWNSRVELLGPALASFISIEKMFVEMYATELSEIHVKAGGLVVAPSETLSKPLASGDIPTPSVAGDLQAKKLVMTQEEPERDEHKTADVPVTQQHEAHTAISAAPIAGVAALGGVGAGVAGMAVLNHQQSGSPAAPTETQQPVETQQAQAIQREAPRQEIAAQSAGNEGAQADQQAGGAPVIPPRPLDSTKSQTGPTDEQKWAAAPGGAEGESETEQPKAIKSLEPLNEEAPKSAGQEPLAGLAESQQSSLKAPEEPHKWETTPDPSQASQTWEADPRNIEPAVGAAPIDTTQQLAPATGSMLSQGHEAAFLQKADQPVATGLESPQELWKSPVDLGKSIEEVPTEEVPTTWTTEAADRSIMIDPTSLAKQQANYVKTTVPEQLDYAAGKATSVPKSYADVFSKAKKAEEEQKKVLSELDV